MGGGYVLNFTDRTMGEFFQDDLGIDIYKKKYDYASGSKANRMRSHWMNDDNKTVALSISKLIEYIDNQILIGNLDAKEFPDKLLEAGRDIAQRLSGHKKGTEQKSEATYSNGNIKIRLQDEVFDHVQRLLNSGHYFNAVEEAYKIVRHKLREVTGKEKAHEAFADQNIEKIFGHLPNDDVEKDFFEGVKFLHMAIQKLRNEKAHTPAMDIDPNLAIHYIAVASLAYDMITRK